MRFEVIENHFWATHLYSTFQDIIPKGCSPVMDTGFANIFMIQWNVKMIRLPGSIILVIEKCAAWKHTPSIVIHSNCFSQMYTIALLLPVECFVSFGTTFTHCIGCSRNKTFRFEKWLRCEKYAQWHPLIANGACHPGGIFEDYSLDALINVLNLCNSLQYRAQSSNEVQVAWLHKRMP